MSRTPDFARIHAARREGTLRQVVADQGISIDVAEAWCDRWESTTSMAREDQAYWEAGYRWIVEQRSARRPAPNRWRDG